MKTALIRYVVRKELDTAKWDRCIAAAANELIYACSDYLDAMARHWDGLILGDYEAVMPLTWNRKFGIRYLYQPPYTSPLGIFSHTGPVSPLIGPFLEEVKKSFRFAEIFLNHDNAFEGLPAFSNYTLDLRRDYEDLRAGYKSTLPYDLKKAEGESLLYGPTTNPMTDLTKAIQVHQKVLGNRFSHVKQRDYDHFCNLCQQLQGQGGAFLRAVYTGENNPQNWLAVALLLRSRDRIYLIMTTTLASGREQRAGHFLLDNLIREFAGQELILDFVGSDIPGVAHFYKGFGAINQPIFFFRCNRLPFPIRYLKG